MTARRYNDEMSFLEVAMGLIIMICMLFGFAMVGLFAALIVG
jgi:hypothetical protein